MSLTVAHIATRHVRGGAATNIAFTLAEELKAGYTVHFLVGNGDLAPIPEGISVEVMPDLVRSPRPLRDWAALRAIRSWLVKNQVDVVHTHLSKAGAIGRLAARNHVKAVVHTIHMASFGPGYRVVPSALYWATERALAPMTDLYVAVGTEVARKYCEAGVAPAVRTLVARSPIGVERFLRARELSQEARARIRRSFATKYLEARLLIVAAGLLEPRKRFDLIIRTLAANLRDRDATLVIAGEGPCYSKLKQLAASFGVTGHIVFPGHVPDLAELFASADLFVHAATTEGVPQVVIQAVAAGLPVVATDAIGLSEVADLPIVRVGRDGRDLAKAIPTALAGPRSRAEPSLLTPWTETSVKQQLAEVRCRIESIAAGSA